MSAYWKGVCCGGWGSCRESRACALNEWFDGKSEEPFFRDVADASHDMSRLILYEKKKRNKK